MILLIDNYDSFAYNLYQLVGSIDSNVKVIRNDELTVDEILQLDIDKIIISPGPGKPSEAGIIEELILKAYQKYPILGVCLGHQAIIEAFGGTITYAKKVMHGKASLVDINNESKIFKDVPKQTRVARYHSLAGGQIPTCLEVISSVDDEVMAVQHKQYPIYGLQFHPESILSDEGYKMIYNFLKGE